MQTRTKRFLAMLLSFALLISMMPGSAAATESVPFSVVVGGESVTEITADTVTWIDWQGNGSDVTRYMVTVPQGATEATLNFDTEKQWTYYTSAGEYIAAGDTSWTSSATHTVAIQDSNNDSELDGISVQNPETYSTDYYIQFEYASAGSEEQVSCLTVLEDAPVTGTVSAGGLYSLNLEMVFADSESHALTYSFDTTVENEHTKIADGVFYFSTSEMGTYEVALTAKCDEAEVSHKLTITVEEANEGIDAQYGYDETAKSSVTVYVTLSNDGYPVVAADGTVMSHLEVTVPYFDLGLYGLEEYYRYGTDGGSGPYTNETIVQRPTGLHLYIYLLECYYMGLEESKCCLGTSGVLEYAEDTEVYYMDGEKAYDSNGLKALYTSGGATSIYMVNFWGHDENLMYFRNHCYPYMSAGWGATSDYILLSDGDTWDVGMFTNWSFHNSGFFARFDQDSYTANAGESITVATQKWSTSSAATAFESVNGLSVGLYDSEWKRVQELTYDSETGNALTFTAPETAGTYYLMAVDPNAKDTVDAKIAPATARVIVSGNESGAVIPEGAPFAAIKADNGAAISIEDKGTVNYSSYTDIPYYHVVIPEGAVSVEVTHLASSAPYTGEDIETGKSQAYGYFAETTEWSNGGYITLDYTKDDNGNCVITFPMSYEATDWSTGEVSAVSFLKGDGTLNAVCAENTGFAPIAFFTFEYGTPAASGEENVEVNRILLNTYAETLVYNKDSSNTLQLAATVLPAEATGWTIVWTSSNEAVATVDQNGMVTAVGEGEAVITAAIGEIKAECTITSEKYNTAPAVVDGAASRTKVKTNTAVELDLASMFTDEQSDTLTYTVEVCEASGIGNSWDYSYTAVEGFDTTVTDGKFSVNFPETGIYAIQVTASDGNLSATHTYEFTVVDNDSGLIKLNDGVSIDFYNVVVVDSSEELVEDYEIPYKGTHDTTIHHIVLSKDTISGTPNRRMDFIIADGYGWSQYSGTATQDASWSTRADIGLFAYDAEGTMTAHYLQFHTECEIHTDEDKNAVCDVCTMDFSCETCTDENADKYCDVCGKWLNNVPVLVEGVEDLTVKIQTGFSYQLEDLMAGKIFEDIDGDILTYESYTYRKSSDGGVTWGEWTGFSEMEFGTVNSSLSNSAEGTYTYEFRAYDGYGYSEDIWTLTLQVMDVVPADINFYVGRDQNYSTHSTYPVLELYRTAGIDENLYDYVGWFTNAAGETVYVYNPADYEITDGETDYVVIDEVKYELHDYEKITFTNSTFDDSDTTATASGTLVGNYNMFYASIESGRYSTRAYGWNAETSAYDIYLGGQSMELPMEKDIYGGGGGDIYLRVVSGYTTSKKIDSTYFTADDYSVEMIMPVTGGMIHSGDPYVSGNYTYFPFMSYAAGNASLYNVYAYPYDTENYIFNQSINNTTSAGYTVVSKSITINTALLLTVNVPETAEFDLYFQYNNFNTKAVEPESEAVVNGDGTKTITYKVTKGNSNYTWRLTDPSGTYVTKAGWLASLTAAVEKTYTFAEGDATNKASHDSSNLGTAVKTRDEADIQVFLDHDGFMSTTDTYRVRAFRMWQLINSDTANIMVEPDFNIQVLQGNASDISLVDGGNANDNWIDVTPSTTDIIAVSYDAIDMYSTADNYGSHGGLFPATAPERTGVFVVTNEAEGTADAVVSFNGGTETDRGSEWDYNYDTWYYLNTDTAPTLDFTVTSSGGTTVSYAVVTTNSALESTLSGWTSVSADAEGFYHADLLKFRNAGTLGGTVIIKMTDSTGISYRLVRVAEMTATVANASNPGEPFMSGDDVTITFDGLYRAVNKVSGIFNPLTYYLRYTVGETEVNGSLAQYQQMDRASITLTIPEDITFPEGESTVDYSFTNGYIYGSMYSASSPFDTLYNMTDTGVGTNFSAVGVSFVLSRLADIPVTVRAKQTYDLKVEITDGENAVSDCTFTLMDPDGNVLTADENGIYQDLGYGLYAFTLAKAGYVGQNGSFRLGSADAENVVEGILTKTIAIVKAAENAWDGTTVTEPTTDENGVYQIGSGAELAWFAQTVNAGATGISAVLTADIDLACYNWTPIGSGTNKFAGSLDGQNHKVYNLSIISTAATGYQGLFGYVYGSSTASASVSNLTVEGSINLTSASSVSQANVGGVAGAATYASLTNVHSNVDITITRVKGNWARVGGVAGSMSSTTVTDSSNTGTISGYQYVGGIAGYESSDCTITGNYNSGDISGYQYVGGITGCNAGATISSSYNTGDVSCTYSFVGGIAGNCSGASVVLSNCFTTGKVTFSGTTVYAGAVTGQVNNTSASVSNVYYLDSTYSVGIGKITGEHVVNAVTAEALASADFVTTINTGLETAAFNQGENHPVLTWQGGTAVPDITYGDIDGDGDLDMTDASLVMQYVNGSEMTEKQIAASDVDGDGDVDMTDVSLILQYVNGMITKFPAEA